MVIEKKYNTNKFKRNENKKEIMEEIIHHSENDFNLNVKMKIA